MKICKKFIGKKVFKKLIWQSSPFDALLGNLFGIPQNSGINPIPDLLNFRNFIGILFF